VKDKQAFNSGPMSYTRQALELRAADYYASIRKPEYEWKSIEDLIPQLTQFRHQVCAVDYEGASQTLRAIDYDYLYLWGYYARLIDLHSQLLGNLQNPRLVMDNLVGLGRVCRATGKFTQAVTYYEKALDVGGTIDDSYRKSVLFGHLGSVYRALGKIKQAIEFYEQALALALEVADRRLQCDQLGHLGMCYRSLGAMHPGIQYHQQALVIAREIGNRALEGANLSSLGSATRAIGKIEESLIYYRQALDIARQTHDRRVEGFAFSSMGGAYRALGDINYAIECYRQALEIARETGYRQGEAIDLGDIASVYYTLGKYDQALELYEQALKISSEIGDSRQVGYHLVGLGKTWLAMGPYSRAIDCFRQSLDVGLPDSAYRAALGLAVTYLTLGRPEAAAAFGDAIVRSRVLLDKTQDNYRALYALATAKVGVAICDPLWNNVRRRADLLASALGEYRLALEITAVPGVVRDALRELELIRATGVEGLEPVFELLEGVLDEHS